LRKQRREQSMKMIGLVQRWTGTSLPTVNHLFPA
jgi:hypothetical protein